MKSTPDARDRGHGYQVKCPLCGTLEVRHEGIAGGVYSDETVPALVRVDYRCKAGHLFGVCLSQQEGWDGCAIKVQVYLPAIDRWNVLEEMIGPAVEPEEVEDYKAV